ncbi:hypothetical protein [Promicromonospora iranensis]|uniref:Peptidase S1 domain-containing protein n=1 Tax=Promicromonospora iranensis TaxID=1105144 RepID=A0ABU2CJR5_9MICO|nr:hypothetical protein [Promicromonospora iranensis]MDR7381569.1 hypothetical protein [Promicromonospora iranensis]
MWRNSTVKRAMLIGTMALTAALAVPATAGTTAVSPPLANNPEQMSTEIHTAVQSAVDHAAGAATELALVPGFAGVAVDYAAGKVTVSWKGEAPPAVGALATRVPDGVTVDVERAALSEADLRAASTRLMDSQRALHGSGAVIAALPAEDHTGLVAEVSHDSAAARTTGLAARLEQAAGVPVRVEVVDAEVQPTAATRRNDDAPWNAGGAMASRDGTDYCTTGFSIINAAGQHRIISAAHCNRRVGSIVRDGAGERLGKVTHRSLALDAQAIAPFDAPRTTGAVFGGPWNARPADSRYRFRVAGVQRPAVGQVVCTSGAVTGEHCGARIRATNVAWSCGDRTCHGFRASRDDGGVVVGGGDSGGPIYGLVGGRAYARGMIDGGSNRRSCGRTSVPTQCFSYVYGIPMVDILDAWDARLYS